MTKVLDDIINKNHDDKACKANCEANGKTFNQTPYQCHYFSGSRDYNNLLELQELTDSDVLQTSMSRNTAETNLAEYLIQLKRLENWNMDIADGVRAKEDQNNELEANLGNL